MIFVIFCKKKKKKLRLQLIKEYTSRKCACKEDREREKGRERKEDIDREDKYNYSQIQAFIFVSCILRRKENDKRNKDEYKRKNLLINANYKDAHIIYTHIHICIYMCTCVKPVQAGYICTYIHIYKEYMYNSIY